MAGSSTSRLTSRFGKLARLEISGGISDVHFELPLARSCRSDSILRRRQ